MSFVGKHKKNWLIKYELLKKYYKEYGNVDVAINYKINGIKLGAWLHNQRKLYKKSKLTKEQINLLNELGMKWNLREENWDEKYYILEEYYKEHGNIDVPQNYEVNGIKLGYWLCNQKQAYKGNGASKITEDQSMLLSDLNIKWHTREENWKEHYNMLKKYYEKYGNINIPISYEMDGVKLGSWLYSLKLGYNGKGSCRITPSQIKLLNDLNIDWNISNTKLLNSTITEENKKEYNVVLLERLKHILEDLVNEGYNVIDNDEKQRDIEEIITERMWLKKTIIPKENKILFGKREENWLKKYELLKAYYKEHGNINITQICEINGVNLGTWLSYQRQMYKNQGSKMTIEQIKMLNELNVDWDIKDTRLLNLDITQENKKEYNVVLLERLKHIIEDLSNEGFDKIDSIETQKEIEKIIIKRMWR